tara:strand:- start:163 stop:546 length:384 start_codon:yes stop_codon:yes gene_type:complete
MSITYESLSDISTLEGNPVDGLHFASIMRFSEATGWDLIDEEGDNMGHQIVMVRDTLEGFEEGSRYFNECAGFNKTVVAGFPALICPRLQVKKGDTRTALSVVDLGEWRMSIDEDVTDYLPRVRGAA